MSASPARVLALEVLTRVRERDAYAHETLDTLLKDSVLEPRDVAFATRLAYGAIATRGTTESAITRVADPGTALEPRISDVLVLGAHELLFAGTPVHAAVSEAVALARTVRPQAAGLVNALMRRLSRAADEFPWGDPEQDLDALARLHGHPLWLAELWVRELGWEVAASLMAADNEAAPLFAAHLPGNRTEAEVLEELSAIGAEPEPCALEGCVVLGRPSATRAASSLSTHELIVMDAGAQFAVLAVLPQAGQSIVEIGAGRGGKSLLLAATARRHGGPVARISAVDLHDFKLQFLREAAAAVGYAEISTYAADATELDATLAALAPADAVLVDAPCSGLGTLRRHPDRRWRAAPQEIETLASLGEALLSQAASLVNPGGFVVYSTCTIANRENAEVITRFLSSEAGSVFELDDLAGSVPDEWRRFVAPEGWFQSYPEPGGPDGHFVARMRRR